MVILENDPDPLSKASSPPAEAADPRAPSDRHVRIATLAYARGMLKLPAFAEVMGLLGRGSGASLDELWIASGRLTRADLEALLVTLDEETRGARDPSDTRGVGSPRRA